ncbi:double-strand-break repair protein rad21-like protein 1 isoform X2 [Melanerpes formicivorus]|uniref:double-strand-break repair protein rad21-like protein 1 isoform X2 n=1 Tax=Melanerpes formicivorus TaxID=211600 RepID=UPI00358FF431
MFYLHLLISKRGPLAKIWLAAHWEKKLTKAHIFECNLEATVERIISPRFTLALRTSGHLLLGVVRIYHRKAKYLLADCSEALTKMKTAFCPGLVDLPEENFEAAYQSVTLPEEFHDFEAPLPALNAINVVDHFTLNQSRAEDITLTEGFESSLILCGRSFDEEPEALRKKSFLDCSTFTSSNSLVADHCSLSANGDRSVLQEDTFGLQQDCFGDEEDAADMIELLLRDEPSGLENDLLDVQEDFPLPQEPAENSTTMEPTGTDGHLLKETELLLREEEELLLREEEGFVLQPVADTAAPQRKKTKRKRKLLVDVVKELSCSTIYNQLNDCSDILTTLDLAPPSKRTMMWKEWGGVDKLLSQPGQPMVHSKLQMLFEKCFKSPGLKMRRKERQGEPGVEDSRKEQDTTEILSAEEPGSRGGSAHPEPERTMRNGLVMMAQHPRNGDDTSCGGSREAMVCSESSSLMNLSPGQAAEAQQDESPSELMRNGKDGEETRWSKRTLQLLRTLQHLRSSGASSFSFQELCWRSSRKEAAARFSLLLVLKKCSVIQLRQSSPFADITVTPGPMFDAH